MKINVVGVINRNLHLRFSTNGSRLTYLVEFFNHLSGVTDTTAARPDGSLGVQDSE